MSPHMSGRAFDWSGRSVDRFDKSDRSVISAKSITGELQAGEDPKRWVVRSSIGFKRSDCDYPVYIYQRDGVRIMVPIHVDDLLLASNSKSTIRHVKSVLAAHFNLRGLGPATSILGMKIARDRSRRSISLSQPGCIESILDDFVMSDCNPSDTPIEEGLKPSVRMSPNAPKEKMEMKHVPYRVLISNLLYLAVAARPDIAYVVGVLCRFIKNPRKGHWLATNLVLRYLKGTVHMELVYSRTGSPYLFTTHADADLSCNLDNSRSTGGFAIWVGGAATQWGSRLQPHVSLSSTESKYMTLSKVGCKMIWTRNLFEDLRYDVSRPSSLLVDNKSSIQVAKHPEHQSTMKHVHRTYHWIRDHIDQGCISVSHIPGDDNPADIFIIVLSKNNVYIVFFFLSSARR